ncbi:MAG TPA: hypothetical protein VJT73_19555 [Polyangiaceae bacterium]|nr:hypothetical protein [Polyangiaceae bacterium]
MLYGPRPMKLRERMSAWAPSGSRRRRLLLALGIYLVATAIFFACAPRQLVVEHTSFNHYALLADAWLHGRLDLGHPPPAYTQNNDFAEHAGRWFVSFPPFPAVVLLPFAKVAGTPENLRDGQIWLWCAAVGPALLFLCFEKLRRMGESSVGELGNVALSFIFAFGTVYFFSAEQGTVWFAAHVVSVALSGLFLLYALDAEGPILAGLAAGLLFTTRPPVILISLFFALEVYRTTWRGSFGKSDMKTAARKLVLFALPVVLVLGATAWHNRARFGGGWLEFGHEHLTVGWRGRIDKWGLFSYHYLARNLGIVTSSLPFWSRTAPKLQVNTHGLALWVTTPLYLWLLWPRKKSFVWRSLAISIAPVALAFLLYQNSGWLQFGYRFSNDYAVFLFALLAMGGYKLGRLFYAFAAWGIAVNTFGALTFQRQGGERFYYTDNSQQIIYQPD